MRRPLEPAPPFLGPDEAETSFDRAGVAILPVPYEATVCWAGGTARGPEMIQHASPHLEWYDEQMDCIPAEARVWTDAPLPVEGLTTEEVLERIEARVGQLLDAGKWVVMLGGEHSITPGAVRAAAGRHPGLHVVQFDAHADMREDFKGNRFSHACAMARCEQAASIRALGIRSYTPEEARAIREGIPGYRMVHAWEMDEPARIDYVLEGLAGQPVYLTFDLDCFDPAILPATGTPEPGGTAWYPTLGLLERIFELANVVACDVVELAPQPGLHHADFTAARLVYKLIGMHAGGRGHQR